MKENNILDNRKTQTKISQSQINPDMAIGLLKSGNGRFLKNASLNRSFSTQITETATGQYPFAVILSCIDSRIPTEIIFDQGIGDVFNARIAGNFVNEDILGSMEFACKLAGSKLIVVMGHTSCGAVKGACDAAELGNLTQMLEKIQPAVAATTTGPDEVRNSGNLDFVNRVALENVKLTMADILDKSDVLREMESDGSIGIVGAMYDVATGKVQFV